MRQSNDGVATGMGHKSDTDTLCTHQLLVSKIQNYFQQIHKKKNKPLLAVSAQVHTEPNAHKTTCSAHSCLDSRITCVMKGNKCFTYCGTVSLAPRMTV